jgi:hypothetical protein
MHSRSRKAEKEPHVAPRLDCQERTTINKDLQKKRRTKEKPDQTERHDEDKGEGQTKG